MEILYRLHSMMSIKNLRLLIIVSGLFMLVGCNKEPQLVENKCGVDGIVSTGYTMFNANNGIKVTLTNEANYSVIHTAVTDGEGRFQFRDIEAGIYYVDAVKEGYYWSWMVDDGEMKFSNNKYIELKDNKIKDLEIQMWSDDDERREQSDSKDLAVTDMNGKPISRLGLSYNATMISIKVYNGTQVDHTWDLQYNRVLAMGSNDINYSSDYVFTSFNVTEGVLKPGDNIVLVGYINPLIYDHFDRIYGVLYFTDHNSFSFNFSKSIEVYFDF